MEDHRVGVGVGEESFRRSPRGLLGPSKPRVTAVAGPPGESVSEHLGVFPAGGR